MKRWLSISGIRERYTFSESSVRRLIKAQLWPKGDFVTQGRKVWSEEECDAAFAELLKRTNKVNTKSVDRGSSPAAA